MALIRGLILVCALALVAGCEAGPKADDGTSGTSTDDGNPNPEFTGPWKDEFARNYRDTTAPLAKAILADEVVTEAEMAEMNQALITCIEGFGLLDAKVDDYGGHEFTFPSNVTDDTARAVLDGQAMACQPSTGWDRVISLYVEVRRNPSNGDISEEIASCLVRAGLRPPGYSAEDYRLEYASVDGFSEWKSSDPEYATLLDCEYNPASVQ